MMKAGGFRRPDAWLLLLLLLAAVSVPFVWAQEEDDDFDTAEALTEDSVDDESLDDDSFTGGDSIDEGGGDLGAFGEDSVDFGAVDELLEQDAEIMSDPRTYAYDPGARRDPFRSLIQRQADDETDKERPEGVPGLLVDEIAVQGIFMLPDGPVAQVVSTSQDTSFLVRPGDQLWDGEVVSMTLNEVVFKQDTDDQNSLKPFREVVKKLDPRV